MLTHENRRYPNKMDDTAARQEWGWNPKWDLDRMTQDMFNPKNS
jgi:nucleoside-diphosphate-sugar epimerase